MLSTNNSEFSSERSNRYKIATENISDIWNDDVAVMLEYLSPQEGDKVLKIGAGTGFFSFPISKCIGNSGILFALDPSEEQLSVIMNKNKNNIIPILSGAEDFSLTSEVNKIWSRGAFHHVKNKTECMKCCHRYSSDNAKLFVFDIFSHNKTSKFFDSFIARSCITGHEVSFLTKEFSKSLCFITGWKEPSFFDYSLKWTFSSELQIGQFLFYLLGIKEEYSIEEILNETRKYLTIDTTENGFILNWDMTLMVSEKA